MKGDGVVGAAREAEKLDCLPAWRWVAAHAPSFP